MTDNTYRFSIKKISPTILDRTIVSAEVNVILSHFARISLQFGFKLHIAKGSSLEERSLGEEISYIKHFMFKSEETTGDLNDKDKIESILKQCVEMLNGKYASACWSFVDLDIKHLSEIVNGNNTNIVSKLSIDKNGNYFDHLYDREHQIKIVLSAVETAIDSNFEHRYHCVLWGEPACGKTDILNSLGRMLGEEGSAYLKLDGTSTTKAGAEKVLLDTETRIPNVLIIEEIEKANEENFKFLLGLLDERSEIRKTTYRDSFQRKLKILCLATVNDMDLFKKRMSGALFSRFPNKIYCPRPSKEVLKKILLREVKKANGKEEWVDPAIEFCTTKLKINDPREIIPICLCGKDSLLDGSYQESIIKTRKEFYSGKKAA